MLSATQPEGLPEQPTTGTPPGPCPAPAGHQRARAAQFRPARGIASISPSGALSILMSAYSEEPAGTHMSPFDMDLKYDAKNTSPRSLNQSEKPVRCRSGVRLVLGCAELPKGWGHGGSGWEWCSLA